MTGTPEQCLAELSRMKAEGYPAVRLWVIAYRFFKRGLVTPERVAALLGPPPPEEDIKADARAWLLEVEARRKVPAEGPGTELAALYAKLGFESCPACKRRADLMNRWGSKGCRKNYWTIVGWNKDAAASMGWAVRLINWGLDPIPGFVTEAIERAEAKGY